MPPQIGGPVANACATSCVALAILIYNSALIIMLVLIFSVLRIMDMDIGISEKDIVQPTANNSCEAVNWISMITRRINQYITSISLYLHHTFQEHNKEEV